MLLPLILRPIACGGQDARSPYGYPGPLTRVAPDPSFLRDALRDVLAALNDEGVVSLFVRMHPILNPVMPDGIGLVVRHGDTVAVDLGQPESITWQQYRRNHRAQIKLALREGCRFALDDDWLTFDRFKHLYLATMTRVAADAFYHFDDMYFESLRAALGPQLRLATVSIGQEVVAAGLIVETCGIVQMHLTGADPRFARHEPGKLLFHGVIDWSRHRGNRWLHLGGGRGASSDSLLHFKAGFSPVRLAFHTLRVVVGDDRYRHLVAERFPLRDPAVMDGSFPVYR